MKNPVTRKKATSRRTVARFVKLLGACRVPAAALGKKTPQAMWAEADDTQRSWLTDRFCPLRLEELAGTLPRTAKCWCSLTTPAARTKGKKAVFDGYARFRRTGKLVSA